MNVDHPARRKAIAKAYEKQQKLQSIKDARIFRRYMKAQARAEGRKYNNEAIGFIKIPKSNNHRR